MKWAKEQGAKFIISPDAHSIKELDYVKYGIQVARKGWLEIEDIINTRQQENFFCNIFVRLFNTKLIVYLCQVLYN